MIEEAPGIFWIGTQNNGLIRDDRIHGTQQKFMYDSLNKQSINSNTVTVARVNAEGNLWLGTNGGGIDLFNPLTHTFNHYIQEETHKAEDEGHNNITALYVDKNANLWVGAQAGLDYLNTKTEAFTRYNHNSKSTDSLSPKNIISLLEDEQHRLWMGAYFEGVYQLNLQTKKFKHYLQNKNITSSIYEDSDGTIWVGTKDGLYRFDSASDNFMPFIDNAETLMDAVLHISEDKNKNLWIVTGNELIRLNPKRTETIHFGKTQGINPNTLAYGDNGCSGAGDEIFFGDQSGYYAFQPDQLTFNPKPPQIDLTDFRVSNQTMQSAMDGSLNQPFQMAKEINLKYNQNVFSFDFVVMHYSNPKDNRLIYMLQNYDETWRVSGVGQRAYYFDVPPGKYILKVKATNGNGVWSEKDIQLNITPPWWRTWWAYTIFSLLFIGIIWGFIFYRSQKLRRENRKLEEKVSDRTAQLKQSLEDLKATQTQLIQSEKMASLGELTAGIAHEIQNPLNFVNNFSEVNTELIAEMHQEIDKGNIQGVKLIANDIKENEQKINHHGKRADAIVKGMLQHSRKSTGQKEPTDINALCDEYLRLSYHGLRAKDKSFNANMQTDFDENIKKINVVPQNVGRVLLNLFNNAFYSVNEKKKTANETYQPTVSVQTKELNDKIQITVKDNGNGIPQKVMDKIFQPFFTTKPTGEGTGLGLSLSYDIIKTHGGEIKVETKEGEGSEFIIQLPFKTERS
ncbi:MAG: ATP-binding protein [Chitinophagaceae bacterium]